MPESLSGKAPTEHLPSRKAGRHDSPNHTSGSEHSQFKPSQGHETIPPLAHQGEGVEHIVSNEQAEVDHDARYEGLNKRIEAIERATTRLADSADELKTSAANPTTSARQLKSIHDLVKGLATCMTKFTPEQNKILLKEATELYQGLARDTIQNIASLETVVGRLTENMNFITVQCAQLHNKVNALSSHRDADDGNFTAIPATLADMRRDILQKLRDLETRVEGHKGSSPRSNNLEVSKGVHIYGRQILREVRKMLQAQTQSQNGRSVIDGVHLVQVPQPLHQGSTGPKSQGWAVSKMNLPNVSFATPFWVNASIQFFNNFYITFFNKEFFTKTFNKNAIFNNTSLNNNLPQIRTFLGQTLIIYIFLIFATWLVPQLFFLVLGPVSPMAFAIPLLAPFEAEEPLQPVVSSLRDVLGANVQMVHLQLKGYMASAHALVAYWGGLIAAIF